ncbi:MAG: heme-binding protein [Verrucomicrobia bacterium]|nr:heme-binding protein [Verrucomicrobiota bacterium]
MMRFCLLFLSLLLCQLPAFAQMQAEDVQIVINQAAARAKAISPNSFIAVVDREGYVLGVWAVGAIPTNPVNRANKIAAAVAKAGTAAFLSSNDQALTSRTAGFIVQQHFPPGIANRPPGPLVGVNFSNLPFSRVNRFKDPGTFTVRPGTDSGPSGANGAPIPGTSLAGSPGGVPLYKNGIAIGGIGVTGDGSENIQVTQVYDVDEDIALAGQVGYSPHPTIAGSNVFIDGIRVAYISSSTQVVDPSSVADLGGEVAPYPIRSSPNVSYPKMLVGGVLGEVRAPIRGDPLPGLIDGQPRLSAREVRLIIARAAYRASITRGGIRLPVGQPAQVFISVIGNPNEPGGRPPILGTFRTPDATIFSWDVSVQKARTALFFSNNNRAFSTRTVGFMAQSMYPPGIVDTTPGPFLGLQERFSGFVGFNSLNGAFVGLPADSFPPNPNLPNGITIFPGGFPLYRNGVLIGAIGISGDGIDQDDLIGSAGTVGFRPPQEIRADRMDYRGARLPYAKFPRNPEL